MLAHHLPQDRDLLVEGGDDSDLGADDCSERGLDRRRLAQPGGTQHGLQLLGAFLHAASACPRQRHHQGAAGQRRRGVRVRGLAQQLERVRLVVVRIKLRTIDVVVALRRR